MVHAIWMDFGLFLVMLALLLYVFVFHTVTVLHKIYILVHSLLMLWPLCRFAMFATTDPLFRFTFFKISFACLSTVGLAWTVFALFLTGRSYYLNRRKFVVLAAPSAALAFGILINPAGLFIADIPGPNAIRYGPLFWLMIVVLAAHVAFSLQLMIRCLKSGASPRHRRQIRMAIIGVAILTVFGLSDMAINIVLASRLPTVPGLTSLGIVLSACYFVVAIHRYRVFDIVRIAQLNVVDSMSNGVIVLDEFEVVLERNKALQQLTGVRVGDRLVMERFLSPYRIEGDAEPFFAAYRADPPTSAQIEISVPDGDGRRHILVRCEPISDNSKMIGRVITFQDISELRLLVEASHRQNEVLQDRNRALIAMQDELYRANRKLEQMAVTDSLTGCFNRRYLMQQLEREILANVRYNIPFAIFLFDIDMFKAINDTYGHVVGDEVIRSTAEAVRGSLRRTDILARYGGEEFTVYLPHTNREQARQLAARVREIVAANRIPAGVDNDEVGVTISMGVLTVEKPEGAAVEDPKRYLRDLFAKADVALYEAKNGGRNRIIMADPVG